MFSTIPSFVIPSLPCSAHPSISTFTPQFRKTHDSNDTSHRFHSRPKAPHMTTSQRKNKPTRPPLEYPLLPTSELLSVPLPAALYDLFATTKTPQAALSSALTPTATWQNPLFDLQGIPSIAENLQSFLNFAIDPTLTIYAIKPSSNQLYFTWTLSFIYPLPWRPHVSVAGNTTAQLVDGMVVSVQDDWMVAPITLISQALPRLPDILWLWPAPHAETDAGQRRQLQSGKRYNIIRQAARAEMRAVAKLKHFEEELVWATPALPEPCFEGNLRKREQYSTVSPIAVRRLDEMYEWAVAVPGSLLGSGADQIALPIGEGVRIEVVGERVMAVHRFGGYSLGTEVEKRLEQLLLDLRNDGIVTEEVKRDRVWVRVYDSKVGFNSKGLLVMAMYGGSDGVPRVNEIAIDLSGLVSDNFGQQK